MEGTKKSTAASEHKANPAEVKNTESNSNSKVILIIAAVILILAGLVYLFIRLGPETTGSVRDIMVIIFVLESIVTVAAITVLCMNIAKLANFLKYEIKPILSTTGKTVKKISGTVSFLCDDAVDPVVDTVSTISGIKNAANTFVSLFKK